MKNLLTIIEKHFNSVFTTLLLVSAVLLPIILLPVSDNFLLTTKFYFVFAVAIAVFISWAIFTFVKKSVQWTLSPFVIPFLGLAIVTILSMFLNNTYIVSQLLGYGGLYLAIAMIVIFGSSIIHHSDSKNFLDALIVPALILSLSAGAELLGWGPSRIVNVLLKTQFPSSPVFSLAGSPLVAIEFLAVVLAAMIVFALSYKKKVTPFHILSTVVIVVGIGINGYTLYKAQQTTPFFLPYSASWSIAIDGLKTVKSFLIGFGPDSFGKVYLALKPTATNLTKVWSIQFIQGNTFLFSLVTTLGLAGLASWILVLYQGVRKVLNESSAGLPAAAVFLSAAVLELLLPPNAVILGVQALALIFWVAADRNLFKDVQLHTFTVRLVKSEAGAQRVPQHSNMMVYVVSGINLLLILGLVYFFGRAMWAESFIFNGELAALKNQAVPLYTYQQRAVLMNPYIPAYRRKYSDTNMAIAIALANSKTATAADKNNVVSLIQQSIQEAKASIILDNQDALNWLTLARVYSNLIGVANGADQAAIDSYSQAIALAPTDPILRLELGGIYFRTGKYDLAAQAFENLVTVKSDWPNAYYNLALAYRQQGKNDLALAAYQRTLSLLTPDSPDFNRVKNEGQDLYNQMQKAQQQKAGANNQQMMHAAQPVSSNAATLIAPTATSSTPTQFRNPGTRNGVNQPLPSPTL